MAFSRVVRRTFSRYRCVMLVLGACSAAFMVYLLFSLPTTTVSNTDGEPPFRVQIENQETVVKDMLKPKNVVGDRLQQSQKALNDTLKALRQTASVVSGMTLVTEGVGGLVPPQQLKSNETKDSGWNNIKKHVDNFKDVLKNKTKQGFDVFKNKTLESFDSLKNKTNVHQILKFGAPQNAQEAIFRAGVVDFGLKRNDAETYMVLINELFRNMPTGAQYHNHAQSFIRDGQSYLDRTLEVTQGSCLCNGTVCTCCSYIRIQKLALDRKACIRLVYVPKPRQPLLQLEFTFNGQSALNETVPAFSPQEVCLGDREETDSFLEVCLSFKNTTIRMPSHDDTVTSVSSCIHLAVNLFMKTVAVFPTGCYVLISSSNVKDSLHINKVGNMFVP